MCQQICRPFKREFTSSWPFLRTCLGFLCPQLFSELFVTVWIRWGQPEV